MSLKETKNMQKGFLVDNKIKYIVLTFKTHIQTQIYKLWKFA